MKVLVWYADMPRRMVLLSPVHAVIEQQHVQALAAGIRKGL
jgi:hypothetical protein